MKYFRHGNFLKKFYKSRLRLLISLGVIFSVILLLTGYYLIKTSPLFISRLSPPPDLTRLAQQIMAECKNTKVHQYCYEKKIPLLMDSPYYLNMQQGFEVMTKIQEQDETYGYCHVTAHYLSEREVRNNPENWKSVITKCPANSCSNGCVHGVFMEKFNAERFSPNELDTISQELNSVCQKNELWEPSRSESSGCFHALGHTAMYLSDADINLSLNFCDKLTSHNNGSSFVYSCYQGVFMQIFQPLEAEDKALVKNIRPTKEEIPQFCKPYKELPRFACYSESWPYFYPGLKNPKDLANFCRFFEDKDKHYCYRAVLDTLTSNTQLDIDFMQNYCSQLTSPTPGDCMGYVAIRLMHVSDQFQDRAIDACKRIEELDPKGECYQTLISSGHVYMKNPVTDRENFCKQFPESWQEKCIRNSV